VKWILFEFFRIRQDLQDDQDRVVFFGFRKKLKKTLSASGGIEQAGVKSSPERTTTPMPAPQPLDYVPQSI
jgi:hypothetical protein